ncbi:MAG: hypothetical protein ACLFWR_01950 [Acidimicrobiales bacterium]
MTMTDLRSTWIAELDRRAVALGVLVLVAGYLPLTLLGPGTDLDVGGVYHSGRSILDGSYQVSRAPGSPVFEAATGVLHAAGGPTLVNLGSVLMATVTALAVARLLQREDHPYAAWFGLAVLVNPFVWVAGTSMVDFLWATGFVLVGANLQLSRHLVPAVACYVLAAGCRVSTLLVVAAVVVADAWGDPQVRRRLVAVVAAVGGLTVLVYLPPLFQLGSDIARSAPQAAPWYVQVGRFGVKNLFFLGPVVVALLAWSLPGLWRALPRRWATSTTLRLAVVGFVLIELLFLRFPWKLAHLIPAWLCLVLVLGATRVLGRRGLAVLIAGQILLGVVTVNVAQPDQPDDATGGHLTFEVIEGPWLRDLRCRLEGDREIYREPGEVEALLDTWACVVPWSE